MNQRNHSDRFDHIFIQPTSFDDALELYRDGLLWWCVARFPDGNLIAFEQPVA